MLAELPTAGVSIQQLRNHQDFHRRGSPGALPETSSAHAPPCHISSAGDILPGAVSLHVGYHRGEPKIMWQAEQGVWA